MLAISTKETKSRIIEKLHLLSLTLIFFSGACLYNMEHLKAYIGVIFAINIYTFFYCFRDLTNVKVPIHRYFIWLVLLFVMYTFYGTVLPVYGVYNTDYILFMALIVIDIILLFSSMDVEQFTTILVKASAYASIFICLFLIINEWPNIIAGHVRIGESGSGNVNTVGIFLGMLSIPTIYKGMYERKGKYLLIYAIQTIFLLLTGSKKALLFILIAFPLLYILKHRWNLHKYFVPLVILLCFLVFIMNYSYFYNIIGFRINDFLGTLGVNVGYYQESNSTNLRLMMYKVAWEAFKEHPLFGGGFFFFSEYSGLDTYSHSNYMELLVNYGIIGFSLYYGMFVYVLKRLKTIVKNSDPAKLYFTMIITILIIDTAAVTFSMAPLNYIVLLFAFLCSRSTYLRRT